MHVIIDVEWLRNWKTQIQGNSNLQTASHFFFYFDHNGSKTNMSQSHASSVQSSPEISTAAAKY